MPDLFRGITRIQDADDFTGALTNGYFLTYSSGTGKFSLAAVSPGGSSGQVQYNNAGSFGGAALVTYATSGTILTVTAGATTDVPFAVNGAASHSGDLQQWKVNGTTLAAFNSAGTLTKTTVTGATNTVYADFKNQSGVSCWKITEAGGLSVGVVTTLLASAQATLSTSNGSITLAVGGNTNSSNIISLNSPGTLISDTLASAIALRVRGTTSQTAPLLQLQGTSSTTAGTAQAEIDTAWVDSTHATRKARLLLRAYDTAVREGLRIDADGSYALTAIGGGTVTASTALTVTSPTTTYVPLVVDSPASQSADLAQFKVNGTTKAVVTKDGFLYVGTDSAPGSYAVYVRSTATYPLVLNNTSTSVFYVDSSGNLTLSGGINFATSTTALSLGSSSRIYVKYVQDPAGTSVYMDLSDSGKGVRLVNQTAANRALCIEGATSQSGALLQLQGTSSTTAGTAQAEVDTAWVDSTHASRKARLLLRAYDTAVREGLRIDADGTYALTAIGGGTVTASTALTVTSPTATYIGQIVKGASAQSANLTEWQNSSGTALAYIKAGGSGVFPFLGAGTAGFSSTLLSIATGTSTYVGIQLAGASGQSANLQEWSSSALTVYGTVSENGYFTTRKNSAPADAELSTSELAFWFDDTAGAAKVMFKGRNASGTVVTGEVALT